MSQELPSFELFKIRLNEQGVDYICDTPLPDISACISFLGAFDGKAVVWNMTLTVIENGKTPYIEIQQGSDGVYLLSVGLVLAEIDETVIKKTIIMIRNYKRLVMGRCGFGSLST